MSKTHLITSNLKSASHYVPPSSVKATAIHMDAQAGNQAYLGLITNPQIKIIKSYPF